jgi:hypothetical protein
MKGNREGRQVAARQASRAFASSACGTRVATGESIRTRRNLSPHRNDHRGGGQDDPHGARLVGRPRLTGNRPAIADRERRTDAKPRAREAWKPYETPAQGSERHAAGPYCG